MGRPIPLEWEQVFREKGLMPVVSRTATTPAELEPEPKKAPRIYRAQSVCRHASIGFTLRLPIVVKSEANQRDHWTSRRKRFKTQTEMLSIAMMGFQFPVPWTFQSASVEFTHLYRSRSMDSDNLAGAFKSCRDFIAGFLGIDDGDARIAWEYKQSKSKESGIKVRVNVEMNG